MTRSEIEHARALAETYAPKSTDPLRDATEARSTIELLPRLTLKLLDEREALLEALRRFATFAGESLEWRSCNSVDLEVEWRAAHAAIAKAEAP